MSAIVLNTETYFKSLKEQMIALYPDTNVHSLPNIEKVSINVGVGKFEPKQKQEIADYLAKLTGQKAKQVGTRKAISNFKTRKGDLVGLLVTLRGRNAKDFLFNLIYLALPRTRDFKGVKETSFDNNSHSFSLGIENANIFSVVGFDSSVNFGMQINIVFKDSNTNNKSLLQSLKFPFKKN